MQTANRRSIFKTLAMAAAGFSILPAATTYARQWKFQTEQCLFIPNPEWLVAEYEIVLMNGVSHPVSWDGETVLSNHPKFCFKLETPGENAKYYEKVYTNVFPIRYKRENGQLVEVATFKKVG